MEKSNIKYRSNLYIRDPEKSMYNDSKFFSKITDPILLKKILKPCIGHMDSTTIEHCEKLDKYQKNILLQNSICGNNKYKDPCWGKIGSEYICKCVDKECLKINVCRKGNKLSADECKNFNFDEQNNIIEYEYYGLADYNFDEIEQQDSNSVTDKINETTDINKNVDIIDNSKFETADEVPEHVISSQKIRILEDFTEENNENAFEEDNVKDSEEDELEEDDNIEDINERISDFSKFRVVTQDDIIKASPTESFLVNAGPGTGKTYTIIKKIEHLISEDVPGNNIYALSFTNAAVNEIKTRLNKYADEEDIWSLRSVNVRTVNSLVWRIVTCIEPDKNIFSCSFDKSNQEARDILRRDYKDQYLLEKLHIDYLIIDEIQDLTGTLGEFVLELIEYCMNAKVPVALFGDSCQAIFDYQKEWQSKLLSTQFYKCLFAEWDKYYKNRHNFVQITENHRQEGVLSKLAVNYRKHILTADIENLKKESMVVQENVCQLPTCDNKEVNSRIILVRDNGHAMFYGGCAKTNGLDVYLNAADPKTYNRNLIYHPWISQVFSLVKDNYLSKDDFCDIVEKNRIDIPENYYLPEDEEYSPETFWNYLIEVTGDEDENIINKKDFLKVVSSAEIDDPILYYNYISPYNFEISTIHKAKGREFDDVYVEENFFNHLKYENKLVEHKTMYVALTRPKKTISTVNPGKEYTTPGTLHSYTINKKYKKWEISIKQGRDLVTKKDKYKNTHYQICQQDINYKKFILPVANENATGKQNVINQIQIHDEVMLKKRKMENVILYDILYHGEIIGQMSHSFTMELGKINTNFPRTIEDVFVDGKYTYFRDMESSDDKSLLPETWTVISLTGLGHLIFEG